MAGQDGGGTAQRVGVLRLMHPFPFLVSSPEAASLPGQPLGDSGQRGSPSLQQPQPADPEPLGSWLFPERNLLCPTPGFMLYSLPAVPTLRCATQFLLLPDQLRCHHLHEASFSPPPQFLPPLGWVSI